MFQIQTTLIYILSFFVLLLGLNVILLWPTKRKLLEYENQNLRRENEQNNKLINELQGNIQKMADERDKLKDDIKDLQQIITILAKAQGIDDWRKELIKK